MALTERPFGYPKPTETADYQKQNAIISAFLNACNRAYKIDFENDLIRAGSIFHCGGILLEAESNETIDGTTSNIVKIDISDFTAEYVSDMTGVEWNDSYNGYYDSDGNLYIIKESLEKQNKEIDDIKTLREKTFANAYMKCFEFPFMRFMYQIEESGNVYGSMITTLRYAHINDSGNTLATYEIDEAARTIEKIGNDLAIIGGVGETAKLEDNIIAMIYSLGASVELRAYEFDGTDWSEIANDTITGSYEYSDITRLAENTVATITENVLAKYEFTGSSYNLIGNALSLSSTRPKICSPEDDLVFVVETGSDTITAYRFNGSDWVQQGNTFDMAFSAANTGALIYLNNQIVYSRYYAFDILEFDGEDFRYIMLDGLREGSAFAIDDIFAVNDKDFIMYRDGLYYFGAVEG